MIKWFIKTPRYIDGELIENQWFWFGGWFIYEPDEECPYYEFIYSNWRAMWGWDKGKFFGQILFKFWPHKITWYKG